MHINPHPTKEVIFKSYVEIKKKYIQEATIYPRATTMQISILRSSPTTDVHTNINEFH